MLYLLFSTILNHKIYITEFQMNTPNLNLQNQGVHLNNNRLDKNNLINSSLNKLLGLNLIFKDIHLLSKDRTHELYMRQSF
jgi:hypothetical protein